MSANYLKRKPKIALVHDYLNEFGGAERVLLALSDIWPEAPIYTAFYKKDSPAWERFKDKDVRTSWVHRIPFFSSKLHSPLRFLAPLIWNKFDFSAFDVIIGSSSWYITKGFAKKGKKTVEICYCHTPPRWLYGYRTSVEWQKYWLVRLYARLVGHFMRVYDFNAAQRVDYFIANSKNTAGRILKYYRRESKVVYPPVDLPATSPTTRQSGDYYLVISRIVGGKGLDLAVGAANKLGVKLKIAGKPAGYAGEYQRLKEMAGETVEFLGFVPDKDLAQLYAGAKAFLVLASDEDFGMTPVEAMLAGTPVIAYRGGGYLETVIEGKTGVFFNELSVESLVKAIKKFERQRSRFKSATLKRYAKKFGKERFEREMKEVVATITIKTENKSEVYTT